jgi:hypothetical protein
LTEIPERGTPRYGHATLQQRLPRPLTRKPHVFVNHANRNISGGNGISEDGAREYPWYAAWDLAFHAVAISVVDMDFAIGNDDSGQAKQSGGYFITLVDLFGRSTGN